MMQISKMLEARDGGVVLDLGCGRSRTLRPLLEKFPKVRYIGIDPDPTAAAGARDLLYGFNADIRVGRAQEVTLPEPADVVVSFSVLEHVKHRAEYLAAVRRNLRPDGRAFLNYDHGHFLTVPDPSASTTALRAVRSGLGRVVRNLAITLGIHWLEYQRVVVEKDFLADLAEAGLVVDEAKSFNSWLKFVYRFVPAEHKAAYCQRWLELELWFNEIASTDDDRLMPFFLTRNFVLRAS